MTSQDVPADATKDALLAEIERLRAGERELARLVHELQIHPDELDMQQRELLRYQRELEEIRDAYAELFAFAPIGYVVLDTGGVIREANLAAATLLGAERGQLTGHPLFLHVTVPERRTVLDHIARCRRGETHVTTEVTLLSRTGDTIPVQLSSSPARRKERELFLTTIVDLTERKRAEDERLRAREVEQRARHEEHLARAANEAKDRFIAVLSHELRTPLTPILLALEVVQRLGNVPDSLAAPLEMIRRNVVLEARLIDDLLDLSRIVQNKLNLMPDLVDLNTLVHEILEMFANELNAAGLTAASQLGATSHYVRVDPVRLRQVLWNLMNNAIRNTPPQGNITILTANPQDNWITLSIRDSGRGMDAETLGRVFNFFEQGDDSARRGRGLGLGLAISRGIIEAHGGRIIARSDGKNRGACFTIELPTVPQPVTNPVARASAPPRRRGRRVLLVEDNEDSANALAELLRIHGYHVHVAHCVREALAAIGDIDMVISDIGLPDGTGHELMRQISARRRVPSIALSGFGTSDDLRKSAEAGFDHHLVKPVEPQRLLEVLERLDS